MLRNILILGRCRVCGRMFCCANHQKEHERIEHKEYAYILDRLPIICKKCHRCIYFIHDLHLSCHPFMNQHLMNGNFSYSVVSIAKSNRKRALKQIDDDTINYEKSTFQREPRRKLVPAYKFRKIDLKKIIENTDASQMFVIGFNQILFDSKSVFSPQLNISYNMLAKNIIKSSTPLNEQEKETSPNDDQSSKPIEDKTVYSTPEMVQSSILIVSTKKNTPPGIVSNFSRRVTKSAIKNRKVTFEIVKSPELDSNISVYGTPTTTMNIIDENEQYEDDMKMPNSPPTCLWVNIVRRMRNAINGIPRSISTAWNWRYQKFKKSSSVDRIDHDIRSPLKKRPRYNSDEFLSRKPITSYWVNMSVNSLFRKPLPNYVRRYYGTENHYQ